jgi:hypothetical protein
MVFRDNPQLNQTLQSVNTLTSLYEVIRQMKVAGASVLAMTVASSTGSFTGVGNGIIVASTKRPLDGLTLENAFAENLLLTCSSDSYSGSATAGNEGMQISGTGNQSDVFAFNWPLGSNCSASLSVINGNANNSQGNLLTNSGFETWTSNVPNNFSLTVGAGGTNIFQENTLNYDGVSSCRLTGDAPGTLTSFNQQFNLSTGTSGTLSTLSQYAFNVFVRRDSVAAGAGVMTIDLVDQNGTVILDANGVANSFTINLTALTTIYTAYNVVFRTPAILPTSQYLRFHLTTALTNGRSVYFDKASMGLMTQTYISGPFLSVHAGSTPFLQGDYSSVTIANSRGSGGTLSTWQTLLAQLFPQVIQNEILFPSSSVPTISDALIG